MNITNKPYVLLLLLLLLFFCIFQIAGGAVLAIGIVLLLDENTFDHVKMLETDYTTPLIWQAAVMMVVVVGGYTFLIGFVGWIGHLFDNKQTMLAVSVSDRFKCSHDPEISGRLKKWAFHIFPITSWQHFKTGNINIDLIFCKKQQ